MKMKTLIYLSVNILDSKDFACRWMICKKLTISSFSPALYRRDGPFDIQRAGIFPCNKVIFFLFFAQQVFFSKVNGNKFFIFLNNTLKSEKRKRKQHFE